MVVSTLVLHPPNAYWENNFSLAGFRAPFADYEWNTVDATRKTFFPIGKTFHLTKHFQEKFICNKTFLILFNSTLFYLILLYSTLFSYKRNCFQRKKAFSSTGKCFSQRKSVFGI